MKVACVLLLFVSLAAPGFAAAPDDNLIVPGQRIGKWTLEMTVDDLVRTNGPRNGDGTASRPPVGLSRDHRGPATITPDDYWLQRWWNLSLRAMTIGRESQTVVELVILSEEYRTDKGVRVGVSKEAVLSAYGPSTAGIPTPRGGVFRSL